jgi:hypothetical protein
MPRAGDVSGRDPQCVVVAGEETWEFWRVVPPVIGAGVFFNNGWRSMWTIGGRKFFFSAQVLTRPSQRAVWTSEGAFSSLSPS